MDASWIVTANAGRARIFAKPDAGSALQEIEDMVNEAARLRTAETQTDDLGRRSSSTGRPGAGTPSQASGWQPHTTPVEHQTELFARDVAARLLKGHQSGQFRKLTLVAAPAFLGTLRKAIDPSLASAIAQEIDKDYTQSNGAQLQEQIRKLWEKT